MASTTLTSLAAGSAKASPPCCCARHPRSPRVTAAMLQCCASSAKPFSALPPLAIPPVNSVASSCSHRGTHCFCLQIWLNLQCAEYRDRLWCRHADQLFA